MSRAARSISGTALPRPSASLVAMPMSLSSKASRNVRGKARVRTRSGKRFCEAFERPLDAVDDVERDRRRHAEPRSAASASASDQM